METIAKNNAARANAIIDAYLAWAKNQWWFGMNCGRLLYEKLNLRDATGNNNRQCLVDNILLPEQNYRCCYCMRRINNRLDDASIEHIVPQSTTSNGEMAQYFSARSGGLNAANVCLTPDYVRNGALAPPYPHHVAYHNFVIACRDCNAYRWHKEIEPLFLFAGIKNEVSYNADTGEVEWPLDPVYANPVPELPTMEKVGANRPIIKAIRAVWFYSKKNGLSPMTARREDLIYGAWGDSILAQPAMSDEDFEAYLSLNTEEMWNKLLKYDYFG